MALPTQLIIKLIGLGGAHQYYWEGVNKSIKTTFHPEEAKIYYWLGVDGWSQWFQEDQRSSHEMIATNTHECLGSHIGRSQLKFIQAYYSNLYRLPSRFSRVCDDSNIFEFPRESDHQSYPAFELYVQNKFPYPVDEDLGFSVWGAIAVPLFQFIDQIYGPRSPRILCEVQSSGGWIGKEWEGVDMTAAVPSRYPCNFKQIGRQGTARLESLREYEFNGIF
jgi:hypothetical protein